MISLVRIRRNSVNSASSLLLHRNVKWFPSFTYPWCVHGAETVTTTAIRNGTTETVTDERERNRGNKASLSPRIRRQCGSYTHHCSTCFTDGVWSSGSGKKQNSFMMLASRTGNSLLRKTNDSCAEQFFEPGVQHANNHLRIVGSINTCYRIPLHMLGAAKYSP